MPRKRVVTTQEFADEDTEAEETAAQEFARANEDVSLFSKEEVDDKRIEKVHVSRTDPDEGYLGWVQPSATEAEIGARWGGSEYQLIAKNAHGKIVTSKKIRLAGEPIFLSEVADARWRRANGLKPKSDEARAAEGISMKDMFLLMRQEEAERRAREREEAMARDERERRLADERRREEREAAERERERDRMFQQQQLQAQREHEQRMEAQRREDAERREREHARELEAERTAAAERISQSNQFFQNMLAMVKAQNEGAAQSDPVAMLVQGMELATKMKEGEAPKDALMTILERLPETLAEARETAKAAYQEVKRDDSGEAPAGDSLTLRGPLASKVKALARHLVAQGLNPEQVIDNVASKLMAAKATVTRAAPRAAQEAQAKRAAAHRRGRPRKQQAAPAKQPPKKAPPSKTKPVKEARA